MAVCPHCFTEKPAFSKNCPQCTHEVGFVSGIVFDFVYKLTMLVMFVGMIWILIAVFT